jgi:hypothetical protein
MMIGIVGGGNMGAGYARAFVAKGIVGGSGNILIF